MRVAFHNIKGGCGKTTLVTHLSLSLHYLGHQAPSLFDLDFLQHALLGFMQLRSENQLPTQPTSGELKEALAALNAPSKSHQFFDLGGGIEKGYRNILEGVDLIVVPVTCSPHTIASTKEYLSSVRELGLHERTRVLFNAIRDEEQLCELSSLFPVHFKSHIRRRNGYDAPQVLRGVSELDRYYGWGSGGVIQPAHFRIAREYRSLLEEMGCIRA